MKNSIKMATVYVPGEADVVAESRNSFGRGRQGHIQARQHRVERG